MCEFKCVAHSWLGQHGIEDVKAPANAQWCTHYSREEVDSNSVSSPHSCATCPAPPLVAIWCANPSDLWTPALHRAQQQSRHCGGPPTLHLHGSSQRVGSAAAPPTPCVDPLLCELPCCQRE